MKPQKGSPSGGKSTVQSDPEVSCAPERIYKLGEKGTARRHQGPVQDFDCLKEECLSTGKLFEDPEFPAVDSSIFASRRPGYPYRDDIEWIRPPALKANAQFYVDGVSRFDVKRGAFANYWTIAVISELVKKKYLLNRTIPPGQSFQKNYAGIFRFRFWQHGKWVEVVIDDRLPTYNGELIGMHSSAKNEFWSALLEKAYAKLYGSWVALTRGWPGGVYTDLTGGITQNWLLTGAPSDLFDILVEAQERKTLIGTGVVETFAPAVDVRKSNQELGMNHAYSITKVMNLDGEVVGQAGKIPLLKLKNPLGEVEWTGAWSESSTEWKSISKDKKKELGLVCTEDGEFWISVEDWKKNFTHCEICYLTPSSVTAKDTSTDEKNWEVNELTGEWITGSSAGGSPDEMDKLQLNPQYRIKFEKDSTVIVALTQLNQKTQKTAPKDMDCGFKMYKLPEKADDELPKPLDKSFFEKNQPLEMMTLIDDETSVVQRLSSGSQRQVSSRIRLQAGAYCIVPHAEDGAKEAGFLLRVFSEVANDLEEYDVQPGRCGVHCEVRESCDLDGDEMNVRSIFRKIAGNDWEIDWRENKELLDIKLGKELSKEGISKDACRSIVALLDADCSGKLGYYEFKAFWKNLKIWKAAYDRLYHRVHGYLDPYSLMKALSMVGLRINFPILILLIRRYGTEYGFVKLDDYIMIALKLTRVFDTLEERASACRRTITFTIDEWIKTTLNS